MSSNYIKCTTTISTYISTKDPQNTYNNNLKTNKTVTVKSKIITDKFIIAIEHTICIYNHLYQISRCSETLIKNTNALVTKHLFEIKCFKTRLKSVQVFYFD